jgi:hypothetical protein
MKAQINPILIEIAKEFKKSHSSEPDSVAAIALMIALNWRTNKEPYLSTMSEMTQTMFDMRYDLAQKLHLFLMTQGDLLGQLENDAGVYGGDYEEVLMAAKTVNADYTLKSTPLLTSNGDWEWWEGYVWPQFTFIKIIAPQAINYQILKFSQ